MDTKGYLHLNWSHLANVGWSCAPFAFASYSLPPANPQLPELLKQFLTYLWWCIEGVTARNNDLVHAIIDQTPKCLP